MDGRVVPVLRPTVERSLLALRDMRRLRESCEDARRAVDGVLPFDYAALGFDDGGVDEQQLLEDNIAIADIALLSARDRLCWHKACLPAAPGRHPFDRHPYVDCLIEAFDGALSPHAFPPPRKVRAFKPYRMHASLCCKCAACSTLHDTLWAGALRWFAHADAAEQELAIDGDADPRMFLSALRRIPSP